ncbi:MAG TPA: hypothetical protein VEU08_13025, partial [Vicinamibacterales bacterium]|nr:hypothetical protein [Vicinamibacterales bacterium]
MARAVAAILLIVALAAAISVDVVKAGYGVKGDEATYVSMTLSLAYDHDLQYQQRDLERFWGLYRAGPQGIFLKRGTDWHIRFGGGAPWVHVQRTPARSQDRLYFSKALAYAIVAAPFVRALGLNGFLVLHVLLLFVVAVCGYHFLLARSGSGAALAFTLAFLAAAAVPVWAVFLTSDLFNFALVFIAYFLWAYKEVAAPSGSRLLRSFVSDIAAAVLLGIATYSKVLNVLLIAPVVLLLWYRRRWMRGVAVGAVFGIAGAMLLVVTVMNSGEFNYQGGDRRTFYGCFPFDAPEHTWDRLATDPCSVLMATNDTDAGSVLSPRELPNRLAHNIEYFFIGRHFGFVPYFFPGVVAIALWLASRDRFVPWRVLTFLAVAASTLAILLFFPYTWSGGGGPPGNRYFLNLYPALFFLVPSVSMAPALIAWIGGALFTAKMLVDPFWAAKYTYDIPARGFARRLPVELTMAGDLPIDLDRARSRVPYGPMYLYFLDEHAYPPELAGDDPQPGVWVGGAGRADIIVRSDHPLDHFAMTAEAPIRTTLTVSAGSTVRTIVIERGKRISFDVPVSDVRELYGYACLLRAQSSGGFIPHLLDGKSDD